MQKFRRILWPTDFSDCAHKAREMACDLADQFQAELHVLHVVHNLSVEVPDFGAGLNFPAFVEHLPERKLALTTAALEALSGELQKHWKEDHQAKFAIKFGIPFLEILDYVKENKIDLVILGTHGRSGLAHMFLGSVAQRIVQQSPCPVLTVRGS
jgi:nucleotide-binding universal stress UspA family protein